MKATIYPILIALGLIALTIVQSWYWKDIKTNIQTKHASYETTWTR